MHPTSTLETQVDDQQTLRGLERWFSSNCDGDWEHQFGIRIESLDNPGWLATVDLTGTPGEGFLIETASERDSEPSWLRVWSDGQVLSMACDPTRLRDGIQRIESILKI